MTQATEPTTLEWFILFAAGAFILFFGIGLAWEVYDDFYPSDCWHLKSQDGEVSRWIPGACKAGAEYQMPFSRMRTFVAHEMCSDDLDTMRVCRFTQEK